MATKHRDGNIQISSNDGYVDSGATIYCSACHTNVAQFQFADTPWGIDTSLAGPTVTCTSCHNNGTDNGVLANAAPATGEHALHIASNVYIDDCNSCHGANANTGAHTGHRNAATTVGGDLSVYTSATLTCTNACHNVSGTNDWLLAATITCANCHTTGKMGNVGTSFKTITGGSAMPTTGLHLASAAGVQKHDSTLPTNGCTECHVTPAGTHLNGTFVADSGTNTDRFITRTNLTWTDAAANSGTCLGTGLTAAAGCHTDNGDWARLWSTQADSTATAAGSTRCNVCHGQYSGITGSKGWRTGVGHLDTPTRGLTKPHDSTSTPTCDDCHGYVTATGNHENGKITLNGNGTTWARGSGGSAGYSGCSACHGGAADTAYRFTISLLTSETVTGPAISGGDCLGCHNGVPTGGPGYVTRNVVATDFAQASRHVFGGTVGKWDCVVCHREANTDGTINSAVHKDSSVEMRNVDSIAAGWSWNKTAITDAMHTGMDSFCLACHDALGATGINVNAGNTGVNLNNTRALTPFNSSDGLGSTGTAAGSAFVTGVAERTRVLDVKTLISDNTYNSWHQIKGYAVAYTGVNAGWVAGAWASYTLKDAAQGNINVRRERANMHCADCHAVDVNAHSGANAFMLTQTTVDNTCWQCHNQTTTYSGTATNETYSRFLHKSDDGANTFDTGKSSMIDSSMCRNCHGGNPVTDGWGGIHGMKGTDPRSSQPRYRFTGGAYMSYDPGNGPGGGAWTTVSADGNCYFAGSKTQAYSNCGQHNSVQAGRTNGGQYSRGLPTSY
jgi:hypothetical protein